MIIQRPTVLLAIKAVEKSIIKLAFRKNSLRHPEGTKKITIVSNAALMMDRRFVMEIKGKIK